MAHTLLAFLFQKGEAKNTGPLQFCIHEFYSLKPRKAKYSK